MASTGVGGALAGIGHALMRRSDIEREDQLLDRQDARQNELMTREDTRQDALLTRQEKREDLMAERAEALALARETRDADRRSAERADDRSFQSEMAADTREHQTNLAGAEAELMTTRWSREDRRALEDQTTEQMAALDARIQDLQDMALKGEVLGSEGEVERQISEAEDQKLTLRSRLVERLYEMGDPRYKDMAADERLYASGYSKDQVVRFMRLAEQTGEAPEEVAEESPVAPGRSDAEIATGYAEAEARTGRDGGLTPEDRAALGVPGGKTAPAAAGLASPAVEAGVEELPDLGKVGRGRRTATTTGRSGAQVADVGELFSMKESVAAEKRAPGRGAQPPKQDQAASAAKRVLEALRKGADIDKMRDMQVVRKMSPSALRSAGFSNDEIRKAQKLPPH